MLKPRKVIERFPLMFRFILLVGLPLLIALSFARSALLNSLPTTAGRSVVESLEGSLTVARDKHGVPHIEAETDLDAFTALGFVHAQDRMWQLELQRRMSSGTLSEVLGRESLQSDMVFRTLNISGAASDAWTSLSAEAKASLEAYANGINAWLESNPTLPIEYRLLGFVPEPWTPIESLAWMKTFALSLSGNYQHEINRLIIKSTVSDQHYQVMFPGEQSDSPITIKSDRVAQAASLLKLNHTIDEVNQKFGLGGKHVGSNAWVIDGRKSGRGPILANDPHLGLQMPSFWYVASLRGDKINIAGMTIPGLPIVVFGHNQTIAWGGTNLMADVQDLFVEQLDPTDKSRYLANGEWHQFSERIEEIEIRADFPVFLRPRLKPVKLRVRSSRHGPIVSDLVRTGEDAFALQWTALEKGDTSYEAFYRLGYADSFSSFREAISLLVAPALNFVYSDTTGDIGYAVAGKIPIRAHGDGGLPVPGSDDKFAWTGYIPANDLPQSRNTDLGYYVSANNKPVDSNYPHFISKDWASPSRARRIEQLIEETAQSGQITVSNVQNMQMDTLDLSMKEILPFLLQHEPSNERQQKALEVLRNWDGNMSFESSAATIAVAWIRSLKFVIFRDELAGFWNTGNQNRISRNVRRTVDTEVLIEILSNDSAKWCNDISTDERESCDEMLDMSLDSSLAALQKLLGDDSITGWSWGGVHAAKYKHIPFSATKLLDDVFERSIGTAGSSNSVNAANAEFVDSQGYEQNFGAGFRSVITVKGGELQLNYMNSTGQSGNFMSEHYDDMITQFRDGELFTLQDAAKNHSVLILAPY